MRRVAVGGRWRLCVICILVALHGAGLIGWSQSAQRPEPHGWYAGDAHVHRGIGCSRSDAKEMLTPQELLGGMKTNDLAVVSVLTDIGNGEMKYAEKDIPLITGGDNPASLPGRILHWDAEWHFDPQGVTFDQKMIGGHLIILGLKSGKTFFSEYTYPVFEWAAKQGAIAGFAHMQYLPEGIPNKLDCCAPLEFPVETALGTSSFLMEDVHGSETAIQAYYRILNCGFRPGLVAATDYSCNFLEPFGTLLTYVRIPEGKLSYEKWIEGIVKGRTVVSRNAHKEFLDFKVNDRAAPGDEIRLNGPGRVQVKIGWSAAENLKGKVELVQDGRVIASQEGTASPGSPMKVEASAQFAHSGWLAARRMDTEGHRLHTGAVYVIVKGEPIRASADDAHFFVRWIDSLIRNTSPGGAWSQYLVKDRDAAHRRYQKAKLIFERIAAQAREQAGASAKSP